MDGPSPPASAHEKGRLAGADGRIERAKPGREISPRLFAAHSFLVSCFFRQCFVTDLVLSYRLAQPAATHRPTTMDPRLVLSFVFAVAALASAQHDHHNHAEHRVDVAVYYESLCPDSRKFFTQQLYPSLQTNLADFVNLTLVPYGKTKSTFDVNSYQFECHHGPAECKGNKIQACALKLVQDPNPEKETMLHSPTIECARINHVSNVNDIDNCADHTDASNYLADYGRQTDKIQSSLKSVPTIVFKNQYKEDDSKMAQTSFVKVLCSYIEHDKPQECLKNGASGLKASICFVFLTVLFSRRFL
ncbi:hypothetical protein NQ317_019417 [Molorchus minor]|uniref:Gamma-interferon-inducible lysosomal thiol reductase n=1 Tax=Molorchus minor TaxID=1323400 RepID=A0ABQ9JFQ8_9CUCU|nr:hypothetical protein NQ317_019417 [Molorchus minor]